MNRIKVILFCAILCLSGSTRSYATIGKLQKQTVSSGMDALVSKKISKESRSVKLHSDTTIYYTRGANGLIIMPPSDWEPFPYNVRFRDTVIYNPAYLPIVFDGNILPSNLSFINKEINSTENKFRLIHEEQTFAPLIQKSQQIQELRRNFYLNINNISIVRYSTAELKSIPKFDEREVTKRNILHELISAENPIKPPNPIELPKADPTYIYWTKSGEHTLQMAQNYISDNWYKGGNSSYLVKNYHKFALNYKKDKISFDNVLEWKLNLQKVNGAEKHGANISEDILRLENTFGVKAFNKWSYSTKLETKTQLFNSFTVNSDEKNTAFLSPLIVNLGVGMNYTLEKKYTSDKAKKVKLSQSISPLSLNYIYLNDTTITKRQGIEEGKRSKFEIGSSINTDLTFSFNRYMTLTSRLRYFTNYQRGELEFENKFNMALNRFLSTTIYLYLRFDDNDTATRTKNLGYFQLNQMLSFGLNYKW